VNIKEEESIFKPAILISYTVKRLKEISQDKLIGKTIIQKLLYILSRESICDFEYSMYYYGPYSREVTSALHFAEISEMLEITWLPDKGYSIVPKSSKIKEFEHLLTKKEKEKIDDIVKKYSEFSATDLSLIATALYSRDKFEISEDRLAKSVHKLKDKYSERYIEELLRKSRIIS